MVDTLLNTPLEYEDIATRWKINKSSRTSQSIILQSACKYLKSIRFHKDYARDFYRLWPTDQNSSNFLHLCINSIVIYSKSRAEATIKRYSWKSCSQTQRCSVEQLLCFFPANKIHKELPLPEPFLINFASCRPVTLLNRLL